MERRLEFLDFARGYAILTVVLYHLLQRFALPPGAQQAIVFGGSGVHLFFLLSGFGLAFSGKKIDIAAFYKRRFLKIWLPFVIALSLSWAAAAAWGLFPDGWQAWLAGAALYQMFSAEWMESFGGHFWFVSTILQFYLIYPLLDWSLKKAARSWHFVAAALLLSLAWWLLVWMYDKGAYRNWNSFFLQFLWEFALGMALAQQFRLGNTPFAFLQQRWGWSFPLAVAGLALTVILQRFAGVTGKIFNDIPILLAYSALCYGVFRVLKTWAPLLLRFLLWISGISFALYLTHILVLEIWFAVLRAWGIPPGLWSILPYFLPALAAAWLFERLIRAMGLR
ncbi:MAG: acyltransferase [Chitinophagales bacterium]|nr:acyltransferase [Chitinophagales bacterium]